MRPSPIRSSARLTVDPGPNQHQKQLAPQLKAAAAPKHDALRDAQGRTANQEAGDLVRAAEDPAGVNHNKLADSIVQIPSETRRNAVLKATDNWLVRTDERRLRAAIKALPQNTAQAVPTNAIAQSNAARSTGAQPLPLASNSSGAQPSQPANNAAKVQAGVPLQPLAKPVDAAYDLISKKLTDLQAAVPAPPRPGYEQLEEQKYDKAKLQFQAQVEGALKDVSAAVKSLTPSQTSQVVSRLNNEQLDTLAVLDSRYQGLRKDSLGFEWRYHVEGLGIGDVRKAILQDPAPALFRDTLASKVDSAVEVTRLISAYQNVSQNEQLRAAPLSKALTTTLKAKDTFPAFGTPDYHGDIAAIARNYLSRADRQGKLALIDRLKPLVQDGVAYPRFLSDPGNMTNPFRAEARIQIGDARGVAVADAIASLHGDHTALMQVFGTLSEDQLLRISNIAVQPLRQLVSFSHSNRSETSVGADPTPLVGMIKAASDPRLIGAQGSYGDRGWAVKGKMFGAAVGAIDNLVANKFFSLRAPNENQLIAGGNLAVGRISRATIGLMESDPDALISGLRKKEGYAPTGETLTKFIVYLHDEKLMTEVFKGTPGQVPLIGAGGPLETFWNALNGNKTGPDRAQYFLTGTPPNYPNVDGTAMRNIGYFTGAVIGSDAMMQRLFEQEASLLSQRDSTLSVILKEIPLGGGRAVGWLISPAAKALIGEDVLANKEGIIQRAQYFSSVIRSQDKSMLHQAMPKPDDLVRTRTYKALFEGSKASVTDLAYMRRIFRDRFSPEIAEGSRYGTTFGGSTLDQPPGSKAYKDPPTGVVKWLQDLFN